MADEKRAIAYVSISVDMSELQEKIWRLEDCLKCANRLMDELSDMELPVLADGLPRTKEEG